jgi:hypothetical protein
MAGLWFVAEKGHGPTGDGCDAFPDQAFAGGVSVAPQLGQAVRVEVCYEYLPQNAPFLRVPTDGGLEDPGELLGHQRGLLPAVVVCGMPMPGSPAGSCRRSGREDAPDRHRRSRPRSRSPEPAPRFWSSPRTDGDAGQDSLARGVEPSTTSMLNPCCWT